jgi:transcriptional regulator with GAF, ATPase, and Fis domain
MEARFGGLVDVSGRDAEHAEATGRESLVDLDELEAMVLVERHGEAVAAHVIAEIEDAAWRTLDAGHHGVAVQAEGGCQPALARERHDRHRRMRSLAVQALERSGDNQTHAATLLGLNRDQIRYRIEKFGLLASAQKG